MGNVMKWKSGASEESWKPAADSRGARADMSGSVHFWLWELRETVLPWHGGGGIMYGVSTLEDNRDKELQLIVGGFLREISFIDFALTCGLTLHSQRAQWWVWLCALFASGAILDWKKKDKLDCKRSYLVRSNKKWGSESSARHLINAAVFYWI